MVVWARLLVLWAILLSSCGTVVPTSASLAIPRCETSQTATTLRKVTVLSWLRHQDLQVHKNLNIIFTDHLNAGTARVVPGLLRSPQSNLRPQLSCFPLGVLFPLQSLQTCLFLLFPGVEHFQLCVVLRHVSNSSSCI